MTRPALLEPRGDDTLNSHDETTARAELNPAFAPVLDQRFVDKLKRAGWIRTSPVEAAFRALPRRLFLPGVPLEHVYQDGAVITKRLNGSAVSSASQPSAMALMLEQLQLAPGQRVLEIGAGTGYNAALMSHIVGPVGQVVTLDIDEDLVANARRNLSAAGFERTQAICADGAFGHPDAAPYDRIILTVGFGDIAPAWRDQLKPGGRLVMPLSIRPAGPQISVAFEPAGDCLTSVAARISGFIMLRGAFGGPETHVSIAPEPGLTLIVDDARCVKAAAVLRALTGPSRDSPAGVQVTLDEIDNGLILWLALREPDFCALVAEGEWAERGSVPPLFGYSGEMTAQVTAGLVDEQALCVLRASPTDPPDDSAPFDLVVRSFHSADGLAQRLADAIRAWDAAGRPSIENLRIRGYSLGGGRALPADEIVFERRWMRFAAQLAPPLLA